MRKLSILLEFQLVACTLLGYPALLAFLTALNDRRSSRLKKLERVALLEHVCDYRLYSYMVKPTAQ